MHLHHSFYYQEIFILHWSWTEAKVSFKALCSLFFVLSDLRLFFSGLLDDVSLSLYKTNLSLFSNWLLWKLFSYISHHLFVISLIFSCLKHPNEHQCFWLNKRCTAHPQNKDVIIKMKHTRHFRLNHAFKQWHSQLIVPKHELWKKGMTAWGLMSKHAVNDWFPLSR